MEKSSNEEIGVNEFEYPVTIMQFAPLVALNTTTRLRGIILSVWYCLFVVLQMMVMLHLATSPFVISANLTCTAAFLSSSLHAFFRQVYLTYKRNEITELIHFIQKFPHSAALGEGAMRLNSATNIKQRSAYILVCNMVTAVLTFAVIFIVPSFVSREHSDRANDTSYYRENHRMMYSEMWWYTDFQVNSTYYLVILWQLVCVVGNVTSTATTDVLVYSLLTATAERSAMLARAAPRALLPIKNGISSQFRLWVQCHQYYLAACSMVNKVVGPVVFTTTFLTIINIISFSYLTMKVDIFSVAVALIFLATSLTQVYTFAIAGQHVIDNSEELGRSTLSSTQVARGGLCEGPSRSALLVLAARCSGAKSEEISGMGYFVVSVPLFSTVIGAAASFLLILVQFQ